MNKQEVEILLNEALNIMKTWNKELYDETLQDPKEIKRLIKRQKEYDDFIHYLAKEKSLLTELNTIIQETKNSYIKRIAVHIVLVSKDFNSIDLSFRGVHISIADTFSYCSEDVVDFWLPKVLEVTKKDFPWFLKYFANYIAKNCLSKYADLFIEDNDIVYNSRGIYEMLAMTKHPKAKSILTKALKKAIEDDKINDETSAATALMLLHEESGMHYFRELIVQNKSYDDMGREIALWGDRSDITLLLNDIKEHKVSDVLEHIHLSGYKQLIYFYLNVMKSNWEEDMKEIAFESIVQLFIPKEEHKYYYDLMDTGIWKDIILMWEKWIEKNYDGLPDIRYYYNSKPWNIKNTLHEVKKSFNDPIGSSRWQRVIIYTGHIMPFDPMAYYEKQLAQNKAMEDWIDAQGEVCFKEGRWYRFGNDVTGKANQTIDTSIW